MIYRFSTSDGHQREETAELLHEGTEYESIFLKGSYQYLGADGKTYTVNYIADDNGFHPEGDHFEVPPFVPWPSKIDLTNSDGELKDSENIEHPSKPISVNTIKFLTTQRPPKFEYRPVGSSTVPNRYFTTPKSFKTLVKGRQSKSFSAINEPEELPPKITQQYIPTSTQKPPNRGDVVGSSTAKNSITSSIPKITLEYIPTSSLPPKIKGDIEGTPTTLGNARMLLNQRRSKSKYTKIVDDFMYTTPSIFGKQTKKAAELDIHPTIIYEGRPRDDGTFNIENSSISIPLSRMFGSRTKSRKTVSDFVTTEYPSFRNLVKISKS